MFKVTDVKSGLISLKIVFLFLVPYLFTYLIEHEVTDLMKYQKVADSIFNLTSVYQKLITAGPRELRQNYTALIDINPEKDKLYRQVAEDIGSPCGAKGTRNALAQLLVKIVEQKPAEIVIDKYFPVACGYEDAGTAKLKQTLQRISLQTPVVVGRLAQEAALVAERTEYSGTTPALQASLKFKEEPEQNITDGIVNLDPDNRKLALKWWVRADENSQPGEIPTLSFAAVNAYYHAQQELTEKYPRIKKLLELEKNPYISFIERSKFELIPAGELINSGSSENFSRLRGKIVIIGESGNQFDMHDSVFDIKIPGFILQANYIEAMLDQRYYDPIPWLDYVIGFLVFVAVSSCGQYIQPAWKLVAYLSLILGSVFLLLYLPVALFGFYINPITISSLAIAILITHQFFPKHQSHQKIREKEDRGVIK